MEATQVGKREDLADIIAVVDAKKTPFTSSVKKGKKPTAMLYDWQVDAYDPARSDGVPEGVDAGVFENAAEHRERLQGMLQKLWRTPMVTTEAEEVSVVAGIRDPDPNGGSGNTEFERAKGKKMVELKHDMELTFLSNQECQNPGGGQARLMRGMGRWVQSGAQAVLPVPEDYRTPPASIYTGSIGAFDEDDMRALLQSRWEQTGAAEALLGLFGTAVKNAVTDFQRYVPDKASNTIVRTYNADLKDKRVVNAVDMYDGDYGSIECMLDSYMPGPRVGYILDMAYVILRSHTPPRFRPLPDGGAGPRGIIETITGIAVTNPLAHAKIDASA